ncbi:hypothetical protein B0T26DRAFT_228199 [Lasiosphaeria miniovina]|uniref:Uncharacterized protein n=1 Tax=Lasiosphaeria miniovina TaxID=1954250 RepID=A0AA40AVA0_9PEZI|nr:uncharacterized protein B0T26DRAFT_228199 [Lasiosphaeria miniovina]KAK0722626.1 hypothetical protein B0T26DRAFT_228199 [Lasiosphaeria miniovina]
MVFVVTSTPFSVNRPGLALVGLGDLAVLALMITATVFQLSYLPASDSGCFPYTGPQSVLDMFTGIGKENNKTPGDVCKEYSGSCQLAFFSIAGLAPAALIGIFAPNIVGILALTFHLWIIPALVMLAGMGLWKALQYAFLFYIGPFLYAISMPLRVLLSVLGRIPAVVRYKKRRADKFRQTAGGSDVEHLLPLVHRKDRGIESELTLVARRQTTSHRPGSGPPVLSMALDSAFENLFGRDEVILALIRNCHFVDVLQLSRTSRTLRSTIYRVSQQLPLLPPLRVMTCWRGSKSSCWGCGVQICTGCKSTVEVPVSMAPLTTRHLDVCEARCVRCYIDKMCHSKSSSSRTQPCAHLKVIAAVTTDDELEETQGQVVCSTCAAAMPEELRENREIREAKELVYLAKSTVSCGNCKRLLEDTGPRWWACCECGAECTSHYHPPWRGQYHGGEKIGRMQLLSALFKR